MSDDDSTIENVSEQEATRSPEALVIFWLWNSRSDKTSFWSVKPPGKRAV